MEGEKFIPENDIPNKEDEVGDDSSLFFLEMATRESYEDFSQVAEKSLDLFRQRAFGFEQAEQFNVVLKHIEELLCEVVSELKKGHVTDEIVSLLRDGFMLDRVFYQQKDISPFYPTSPHEDSFNTAGIFSSQIVYRLSLICAYVVDSLDLSLFSDKDLHKIDSILNYFSDSVQNLAFENESESGIVALVNFCKRNKAWISKQDTIKELLPINGEDIKRLAESVEETKILAAALQRKLARLREIQIFRPLSSDTAEQKKTKMTPEEWGAFEALQDAGDMIVFDTGEDVRSMIPYAKNLSRQLSEEYGVDGEMIFDDWIDSVDKHRVPEILKNVNTMSKLEKKHPGGVKKLRDKNGIRHFARYSPELLETQLAERESEMQYGIILNPVHDHNGIFGKETEEWDSLSSGLHKYGHTVRIFEAKSVFEIARHFVSLQRDYGSHSKIAFAIIGGHGNKDSIQFGGADIANDRYSFELRISDLLGRGAGRVGGFFDEHATIILNSCSTGQEGGLRDVVEKKYGIHVIAPPVSFNAIKIGVGSVDGHLDFKVEYAKGGESVPHRDTIPET